MPLITLCGFPCVAKSRFAALLSSQIEQNSDMQMKCIIINEEALHISKTEHYKTAAQEKLLRQNLKSAVEHALNADTFVIFDSCNYIKGYRYELYCIARSQRTPHCVVHVSVDNSLANQWNEDNCETLRYDRTLLDDLRRRFELPNESNRWDKPLFEVNMAAAAAAQPFSITTTTTISDAVLTANDSKEGVTRSESPPDTSITDTGAGTGGGAGGAGAGILLPVTTQATSDARGHVTPVEQEQKEQKQLESTPPPTVFSSWKSNKSKTKLPDDPSVATQNTAVTTASSCFIKKPTASSNVYFSGNRAVDRAVLTAAGPDEAIQRICAYFRTAEAPQATAATNTVRHSSANLLYQIDKASQSITQHIVAHQQKQSPGTPLVFKDHDSFSLTLPRHASMAELQRHRRQYLKITSQHPPDSAQDIGKHFLEFMSNQF